MSVARYGSITINQLLRGVWTKNIRLFMLWQGTLHEVLEINPARDGRVWVRTRSHSDGSMIHYKNIWAPVSSLLFLSTGEDLHGQKVTPAFLAQVEAVQTGCYAFS